MTTRATEAAEPIQPVPVPADLNVEEKLLGPFTARQCAILCLGTLTVWASAQALTHFVRLSPLELAGALAPVAVAVLVLALARPAGVPADRLAVAALAHVRAGRRRASAASGVPLPPGVTRLAPVYKSVTEGEGGAGVIGLVGGESVVLVESEAACLHLADASEAQASLSALCQVLAAQTGPFTVHAVAERVSLDAFAQRAAAGAASLGTPELAALATGQAEHLRQLAADRALWRRRLVIALRGNGPASAATVTHRAQTTVDLLAACGLAARVLDAGEAAALLAEACDPERTIALPELAVAVHDDTAAHCPLPAGVEVHPRTLVVDGTHAVTLAVTGYPAEVIPGWIDALTGYPARLDVALHAEPVPARIAAEKLRRRRTRLEAGRRDSAGRGKLIDPALDSAADSAAQLAHSLARSETKLFTTGLYITVYADTREDLTALAADVTALLGSFLATAQAPTFRMLQGLYSTLPGAPDQLRQTRILDAAALTACAPLLSPDPPQNVRAAGSATAVLAGLSAATDAPVVWDRWREANHNSLILGCSGAGKSFLAKTDLIRELCGGTVCSVIDPEGEYAPIAEAVGGRVVPLGRPGACLNVLDLPAPHAAGPCDLEMRVLDLHALAAVLLGAERAERLRPPLDRSALGAYRQASITHDPGTWGGRAPDLSHVAAQAREALDPASAELAELLQPYTHGSFRALFVPDGEVAQQASTPPLTVYTLDHLPEAMRTPAMVLVLSTIWRTAQSSRARSLLLIDEAWQLLHNPAAAAFVYRIAKSARKHRLGLSLVTQDAGDLLGSELGTAVACNAATQVLLRQAPQALTAVVEAFRCSAGERDFLHAAPQGYALIRTGSGRAAITAIATPAEAPFLRTGL